MQYFFLDKMWDLFISSTSYSANKIGDVVILMEMYLKNVGSFIGSGDWWLSTIPLVT